MGFNAIGPRPLVYRCACGRLTAVVHVEDVFSSAQLQWLYKALQPDYGLNMHILVPGTGAEIRYLIRVLRCGAFAIERVCQHKHVDVLMR